MPAAETQPAAAITTPATTPPAKAIEPPKPGGFFERLRKGTVQGAIVPPAPSGEVKKPAAVATETTPVAAPAPDATTTPPAEGDKGKDAKVKNVRRRIAAGYPTDELQEVVTQAATAAATAATNAVMDNKAKVTPPTDDLSFLAPEEQRVITVFEQMESKPEYKGLKGRAITALKEIDALQKGDFKEKWAAKNAAQFESEADRDTAYASAENAQIAKINKKHGVEWNDADFRNAEIAMQTAPVQKENQELRARLDRLENDRRSEQLQPMLQERALEASKDIVDSLAIKDAGKILNTDGSVDEEKYAAFEDIDPAAAPVVRSAVQRSHQFAQNVHASFSGAADADTATETIRYCMGLETRILANPEAQTDADGRTFVPRLKFLKMPEEQRSKHWSMTPEVAVAMYNGEVIGMATKAIESERKRFAKVKGAPAAPVTPTPAKTAKPDTTSAALPAVENTNGTKTKSSESGFFGRMRRGTRT